MIPGYEDIIKKHRPAGYVMERVRLPDCDGVSSFIRAISIQADLEPRTALFVALHECGHVREGHLTQERAKDPVWLHEYEADQYAIKAMRAEGIPVPRDRLAFQKQELRAIIEKSEGETPDDAVLKYAYGRDWRNHRP